MVAAAVAADFGVVVGAVEAVAAAAVADDDDAAAAAVVVVVVMAVQNWEHCYAYLNIVSDVQNFEHQLTDRIDPPQNYYYHSVLTVDTAVGLLFDFDYYYYLLVDEVVRCYRVVVFDFFLESHRDMWKYAVRPFVSDHLGYYYYFPSVRHDADNGYQ